MTTAPPQQPGGEFTLRPIEDEMRESYLSYAMSVIVARALPDVRDGLKPVQRRILYAMHDMGIRPGSQYRKSARIVGEVLGKFHPHGDGSVYDALVRMAQLFSMRAPLIDGQGNFGSIDGDPPAAMRYTEARLAAIADEMLADIDQQTVDFSDNFDDSLKEPQVLPARMPNLLINGSSGIAVGMATNMPPHNLGEICDAINYVIDHPTCNVDQLMEIVPAPDFPTSGRIRGVAGVRDMYATGRGRVVMEAVTEIEDMPGRNSNRQRIIISELPYQVNKATLVEKIASLVRDKTLVGITEIRDESDRRGIRVVIELARSAQPTVILNNLYKRTALRSSFNAIMLALVDGQPQELPLKDLINHFVSHREDVIRRRTEYQLGRARDRAHIVEGLLKALDAIDAIIETIRNSQDVETARNNLVQQFDLSEIQAQAILDMQLRRLAALERQRLDEEYNDLLATISRLEDLLQNPQKIRAEIKRETREVKRKHADPRRTEIIREELQEQSIEQFIVQEDVVVTLSQRGYIKRVPISTYRNQRRGGKGVRGANNRDDDALMQLEVVNTHDQLLFFTNKGRVYPLNVYEVPNDTGRTARGLLLVNLIRLQPGEQVQTMLTVRKGDYNNLYVFATRRGQVMALHPGEFKNLRQSGLIAVKFKEEGDELIGVRPVSESASIMLVTEQGQALMFPASEITPHKRGTSGVIGIRFKDEFNGRDRVVAMDVVNNPEEEFLLVVTEKGKGKATPLFNSKGDANYRERGRGGMGVQTIKADDETGPIVDAKIVTSAEMNDEEDHEVFIISARAQVIRISLSEVGIRDGRRTKGVNLMTETERVGDDSVVSIACFRATDYSQEDPALQEAAAGTALAQAEEVAAQADSQYEGAENEDIGDDMPDDDVDAEDDDDDPDLHVNGQAPLL